MNKKSWGIALCLIAGLVWLFPQWNGIFFAPSDISTGNGRIIATILFVGGLLLYYTNPQGRSD